MKKLLLAMGVVGLIGTSFANNTASAPANSAHKKAHASTSKAKSQKKKTSQAQ